MMASIFCRVGWEIRYGISTKRWDEAQGLWDKIIFLIEKTEEILMWWKSNAAKDKQPRSGKELGARGKHTADGKVAGKNQADFMSTGNKENGKKGLLYCNIVMLMATFPNYNT